MNLLHLLENIPVSWYSKVFPSQKRSAPHEHLHTTICALATPPGEGGIATVRVSGPDATASSAKSLRRLRQGKSVDRREGLHRHGWATTWLHGAEMDECVALFFRAPHSYTGEDVLSCPSTAARPWRTVC